MWSFFLFVLSVDVKTFTGGLLSLIVFMKFLIRKKEGAKFFFQKGDSPDSLLRPPNLSLVSKKNFIAKKARR